MKYNCGMYVIQDKIQSENKSQKNCFCQKRIAQILSQTDSAQSELSWTNQCLSSLSGKTYHNYY